MADYQFFLSYARRDAVGSPYVAEFCADLAREVGRQAAFRAEVALEDIGFLDRGAIEPGDAWPGALVTALESSHVLVCAYSPAYFNSDYCGRELAAYRQRSAPQVLPLLWDRPDRLNLPRGVSDLQATWAKLGEEYAAEGLLLLKKLPNRYGEAYGIFLDRFADLVVRRARVAQLPPPGSLPPLSEVSPAFDAGWSGQDRGVGQGSGGPGTVQFIFLAANRDEASSVRRHVDGYGPNGRDWRPFAPDVITTAGFQSQAAATTAGLYSDYLPIAPTLFDDLRAAEASNTIAVVLVDPWTLQVASYRRIAEEYDRQRFKNCALLIVSNRADAETIAARDMLDATVRTVLERNLLEGAVFARVDSAADLERQLIAAIGKVRKDIMTQATVHVSTGASTAIPRISGHGGAVA